MAGDVQRAQPAYAPRAMGYKGEVAYDVAASAPAFEEKSFFEYHLYTLSKPATIPDNSTKQLELIPAAQNIEVEKQLIYGSDIGYGGGIITDQYDGQTSPKKVAVFLKFKNSKDKGLGVPLPAGRIRVNQRDSDGSLEFIGEDTIDHTSKEEEVKIKLGEAFDVTGSRKQTNYFVDETRKVIEEEIEVTISNQKKQAAKIRVVENLYRAANWEIISKSDDFTKQDSNTIYYDVKVGAGAKKTIKYKVKYTW
jgi:hypothetical protein